MTTIAAGQPFAMKWRTCLGSANGMNERKSKTELDHNSLDAGATSLRAKSLMWEDAYYLIYWDNGKGCAPISRLYGLSPNLAVKTSENTAGLYLHGHTAAVAYWNPEWIYHESISDRMFDSMVFQNAHFIDKIAVSDHDLSKADVREYMRTYDERMPSKTELLRVILEQIREPEMQEELRMIINQRNSYLITVMKLRKETENPDKKLFGFCKNQRMYYYDALLTGKSITFETSEPLSEHESGFITANTINAIDPHYNRERFPILMAELEMQTLISNKWIGKVQIWNESQPELRQELYIRHSEDGRRKNPIWQTALPAEWDSSRISIKIRATLNVLSELASREQLQHVGNGIEGSDFKSIEDFRGIFVEWIHSIIGKPYWRTGGKDVLGWGAERNVGHIRCCIRGEGDKLILAKLMGIQSSKHNTDMNHCDPIILAFLHGIFGCIVNNYCNYKILNYKHGCTSPWNLETLSRQIRGEKVTAAGDCGAPTGAGAGAVGAVGAVGAIETEDTNTPYQLAKTNTHILVQEHSTIIAKITYKGPFHIVEAMLKENMKHMSHQMFGLYAKKLEELHELCLHGPDTA